MSRIRRLWCITYMYSRTRSFHQNFLINNHRLRWHIRRVMVCSEWVVGCRNGIFNSDDYYSLIWPEKRFIANNSLVIYNLSAVICVLRGRSFPSFPTLYSIELQHMSGSVDSVYKLCVHVRYCIIII